MSQDRTSKVTDPDWEQIRGLFKGAHRDLGYVEPGYARYVIERDVKGYMTPVRLLLEIPLRRSIDKERPIPIHPVVTDVDRESEAFERMLPALLPTKAGLYVAVYRGRIIDEDADEFALARRMEVLHRGDFVLIREVTAVRPPREYLESPEWEAG